MFSGSLSLKTNSDKLNSTTTDTPIILDDRPVIFDEYSTNFSKLILEMNEIKKKLNEIYSGDIQIETTTPYAPYAEKDLESINSKLLAIQNSVLCIEKELSNFSALQDAYELNCQMNQELENLVLSFSDSTNRILNDNSIEISNLYSELQEGKQDIERLFEGEIESLVEIVENSYYLKKIDSIEEEIKAINNRFDDIENSIEDVEESIEFYSFSKDQIETYLNDIKDEITLVSNSQNETDTCIKKIAEDYKIDVDTNTTSIENEIINITSKVTDIENALCNIEDKITQLSLTQSEVEKYIKNKKEQDVSDDTKDPIPTDPDNPDEPETSDEPDKLDDSDKQIEFTEIFGFTPIIIDNAKTDMAYYFKVCLYDEALEYNVIEPIDEVLVFFYFDEEMTILDADFDNHTSENVDGYVYIKIIPKIDAPVQIELYSTSIE